MNVFYSTAALSLLLISSPLIAAPIPFAGAAGITAMEHAKTAAYCATCHLDDPTPPLVWGGRMGVSLVSPFRPKNICGECHYQRETISSEVPIPANMTRIGTIVGGRALPSGMWRYKK